MKVITFLFVVLLLAVIFIEGIMIIDQETRIAVIKKQVEDVSTSVGATIERANRFLDGQVIEEATSSEEIILE